MLHTYLGTVRVTRACGLSFQIDCTSTDGDGQLPSLAFVREAVSMLMLRYPSRLGNLFVVNAGNMVYYLWRAISLLLSPVRTGPRKAWVRDKRGSTCRAL